MTIVTTGAGVGSANRIAATVDRASDAVRASFRLNRQLFSLWARERSIWTILYRGATLGRIFRDVTRDLEHDLGAGTYFTTLKRLATFFSRARATESSRAVLLRLAVRKDMLGSTLDLLDGPLAKEWAETVAVRNAGTRVPLVNEQYNRLVQDFLQCKGTSLEKFDTVIAWDYLHDGPQICIKNDELARKLLLMAEEISP